MNTLTIPKNLIKNDDLVIIPRRKYEELLRGSKLRKEKYIQLLEDNSDILLRAPLGMIASYLGISQETLSRIRSEV